MPIGKFHSETKGALSTLSKKSSELLKRGIAGIAIEHLLLRFQSLQSKFEALFNLVLNPRYFEGTESNQHGKRASSPFELGVWRAPHLTLLPFGNRAFCSIFAGPGCLPGLALLCCLASTGQMLGDLLVQCLAPCFHSVSGFLPNPAYCPIEDQGWLFACEVSHRTAAAPVV